MDALVLAAPLPALAVWIRTRRRLRLIARAEHELRGPLTTIALGLEATAWMDPRLHGLLEDVARARAGLADLEAARRGHVCTAAQAVVRLDRVVWRAVTGWDLTARRGGGRVHLDWRAGPVSVRADRGRLAQVFGNLLANAVEHGGGNVRVTGRRTARGVRIEVRDSGRGHGLGIAARAVREAGGTLSAAPAGEGTAVAITLPAVDEPATPGQADITRHWVGRTRSSAEPPAAA
jgi:signal transduction histidine kinase